MAKPRGERQKDLFRPALDHLEAHLAGKIGIGFLERGSVSGSALCAIVVPECQCQHSTGNMVHVPRR